jgi:uncharacterized repeat protein (TIGR03803 family)
VSNSHSRTIKKASLFGLATALTCLLFATSALAATETVIYSFKGGTSDGASPWSGVTMDSHGNLYGTTTSGGKYWVFGGQPGGVIYKLTPNGNQWTESVVWNFGGVLDGNTPYSGVTIDNLGNLFGSTLHGPSLGDNKGVFYRVSPIGVRWTETGIFDFPGGFYGDTPEDLGTIIIGPQGYFYGTTEKGGANAQGAVFKIDESADETVLYSFDRSDSYPDGNAPTAGIIADAQGNLYGTTTQGGAYNNGTVFELTLQEDGTYLESILYSFAGTLSDGAVPIGGLSMDLQGNLYGTNGYGGLYGNGTVFELVRLPGGGWQEKILWNFRGTPDGAGPWGKLIIDHDGNLYGTTAGGGTGGDGVGIVFKLSPPKGNFGGSWSETILHEFAGPGDVGIPYDGLFMDSTGALYGTGSFGGTYNSGGVFKIVP